MCPPRGIVIGEEGVQPRPDEFDSISGQGVDQVTGRRFGGIGYDRSEVACQRVVE